MDGTGSGGALHSLFQLRAHRETTILVATSIARDVYKPDPPACAPYGWRATSEAAMDYCGVKEKQYGTVNDHRRRHRGDGRGVGHWRRSASTTHRPSRPSGPEVLGAGRGSASPPAHCRT